MIVHIPRILDETQLAIVRARLDMANEEWVDGQVSAGHQGGQVKNNLQIRESSTIARELGDMIIAVLERHPLFISATLPKRVYPPMFNRYQKGMHFGNHVDGAVRLLPNSGEQIRTDISATLFLSAPDEYDGGELMIEDTYGSHAIKLTQGDMIIYPASSIHRVNPITRGVRLAAFFWVQSMVADDAQRTLLFDLDTAVQRLTSTQADQTACVQLMGCYHNLLRKWSTI